MANSALRAIKFFDEEIRTRKLLRIWMCLVVSALFLCDSSFAENGLVLEMGYLSAPDGSEPWLEREIELFEQAHPGVKIQLQSPVKPAHEMFPFHENPPLPKNIIGIDSIMGYETPFLVERGDLVPLEAFEPDPEFDRDAFQESSWETVHYRGRTWGMPWLTWNVFLVCNWPLFEREGIEAPPATWAELVYVAQRLTKDTDGDGESDQWGLAVRTSNDTLPHWVAGSILQLGGTICAEDHFDISDSAVREAFQRTSDLLVRYGVVKIDSRSIASIQREDPEKYGMYLVSTDECESISRDSRLRLALLPDVTRTGVSYNSRRLYFAIRKSTRQEEQASWELLKWFARPTITLPDSYYMGYPTRKDLSERPEFLERYGVGIGNVELLVVGQKYGRDMPGCTMVNMLEGARDLFRPLLTTLRDMRRFDRVAPTALRDANSQVYPVVRVGRDAY